MQIDTITVQFNGQALDVQQGTTISQLLQATEMRSRLVAVEVNLEIIPRESHAVYTLHPGDVIEAVTLVGGG